MTLALANNDGAAVYATAHRFKPVLENMGIASLAIPIREIESIAKEPNGCSRLWAQVAQIAAVVKEVVKELNDATA